MELPAGFDGTFYPPGMENVPRRFAIDRANRYMIDHTDYLIAYAWKPGSNAKNLVEQVMSRAKKGISPSVESWHPMRQENCIDYRRHDRIFLSIDREMSVSACQISRS